MPNNEFIGRRVSVGLGIESAYGTPVAPTIWPKQMKFSFQRRNKPIQNTSAMGRTEAVNDSAIVENWADGPLDSKVYDASIGYLLTNWFGSPTTSDNSDTNPIVKDHLFDMVQSNVAKSLTVTRLDPLTSRRHAMATLETLELTCKQGEWFMVSGMLHALQGTTSSDTAVYATVENSFTSKHITVKLASALAGFGAATALGIRDMKITLKREITKYYAFGSTDPVAINVGEWTFEGEVTLRYDSTSLETIWYNNTQQAIQISAVNTDVTIGAAARPSLVLTGPRVRLSTFAMSDDLGTVVEQTIGISGEMDATAGYMLRALLTNTQASYS